MRELALSRGFYPVFAVDMGANDKGGGRKGGGKGKGKSKGGKSGGASKGKGKSTFVPPGTKQFAFGRRGQGRGDGSSVTSSTTARSTTSGSTASHGPRFKRYRLPASGIKEVPDEANVMEDVDTPIADLDVHSRITDEINYHTSEAGWAIMDSGATRTVCGTKVWDKLADYSVMRDLMHLVDMVHEDRDFRFGDGVVLRSQMSAVIPVCVAKTWSKLKVHVLPGSTPLLLARPDLEKWNVEVNYGQQSIKVNGKPVKPARTTNGHYMINLFDDLQDVMNVTMLEKNDVDQTIYVGSMLTDDVSDMECAIEVEMTDDMIDDTVNFICNKAEEKSRRMQFWEVYVDEGNLSKFMGRKDDVQTRIFSLPHWNFEDRETQLKFLDEMDDERPLHVMVAFECRLWSPMQNMNYRTDERKKQLAEMRAVEERTHLKFYSEIHKKGKEIGCDVTLEQPAEAMSWKTSTLEQMRGYFETVLDRCRSQDQLQGRELRQEAN